MDESTKKSSKRKSEPDVEIFGENVDSNSKTGFHKEEICCERSDFHSHRHYGSLTWGLIFIVVGLMFLLSNFGVIPNIDWSQVMRIWPVIIILIGVDTLMGKSEISNIFSSLIGLFIFATILGIIFIHTSPQILNGLPQNIQNYLYSVNGYFLIK